MRLPIEPCPVEVRALSGTEGPPASAENLDRLFGSVRPLGTNGRRYPSDEVATAVEQATLAVRMHGAHLSAPRKGTKRNPSTELLTGPARFLGLFGVHPSCFLVPMTATRTGTGSARAKVAHSGTESARAKVAHSGTESARAKVAHSGTEIAGANVAHSLGFGRLALRALELSPEGPAAVTKIVEQVPDGDFSSNTAPQAPTAAPLTPPSASSPCPLSSASSFPPEEWRPCTW